MAEDPFLSLGAPAIGCLHPWFPGTWDYGSGGLLLGHCVEGVVGQEGVSLAAERGQTRGIPNDPCPPSSPKDSQGMSSGMAAWETGGTGSLVASAW